MRYYLLLWIVIFVLSIIIIPKACTSVDKTSEVLLDAGYHPIDVGGYAWFQCGEGDWYATKFQAYSPDSTRIVNGCVCAGILKGKTIRLD